jgi:hypothetical protein
MGEFCDLIHLSGLYYQKSVEMFCGISLPISVFRFSKALIAVLSSHLARETGGFKLLQF